MSCRFFCQRLAEGSEVTVHRRKRKRVPDNSRTAPPPGADPASSTNQIPVMVRTNLCYDTRMLPILNYYVFFFCPSQG